MKNSQKGFANMILIVVAVVIVAVGGYFVFSNTSPKPNDRVNLTLPKLTLHKATHFTISLPEDWAVGTASQSGDLVTFFNPKEPSAYVVVFTVEVNARGGRWPKLEERWQFSGRNAVPFKGDDGREGIAAEGARLIDPTKQILAVGYRINDSWEMIVEAGAPKEQFESMKSLFTAILKSLKPDPAK